MLKETLIAIFAVAIIFIGNNVTHSYATETMGTIPDKLGELREIIQTEEVNNEEAKNKMNEGLTEIQGNIEMEEYQEAVVRLDATVFIINHIEEKLAFELENIF